MHQIASQCIFLNLRKNKAVNQCDNECCTICACLLLLLSSLLGSRMKCPLLQQMGGVSNGTGFPLLSLQISNYLEQCFVVEKRLPHISIVNLNEMEWNCHEKRVLELSSDKFPQEKSPALEQGLVLCFVVICEAPCTPIELNIGLGLVMKNRRNRLLLLKV